MGSVVDPKIALSSKKSTKRCSLVDPLSKPDLLQDAHNLNVPAHLKRRATTDVKRKDLNSSMKKDFDPSVSIPDPPNTVLESETYIYPRDEKLQYRYVIFSPDSEILERISTILMSVPEIQKN